MAELRTTKVYELRSRIAELEKQIKEYEQKYERKMSEASELEEAAKEKQKDEDRHRDKSFAGSLVAGCSFGLGVLFAVPTGMPCRRLIQFFLK